MSSTAAAAAATATAPLAPAKPSYVTLQETIEAQPGISGLLITDENGLLISSKGDLTGSDAASGRRAAGHLVQVVKTALTLSDSGAEHVTITIDSVPAPPINGGHISPKSPSSTAAGQQVAAGRQILLTKTNDHYIAISSKK